MQKLVKLDEREREREKKNRSNNLDSQHFFSKFIGKSTETNPNPSAVTAAMSCVEEDELCMQMNGDGFDT